MLRRTKQNACGCFSSLSERASLSSVTTFWRLGPRGQNFPSSRLTLLGSFSPYAFAFFLAVDDAPPAVLPLPVELVAAAPPDEVVESVPDLIGGIPYLDA